MEEQGERKERVKCTGDGKGGSKDQHAISDCQYGIGSRPWGTEGKLCSDAWQAATGSTCSPSAAAVVAPLVAGTAAAAAADAGAASAAVVVVAVAAVPAFALLMFDVESKDASEGEAIIGEPQGLDQEEPTSASCGTLRLYFHARGEGVS